MKLDDDFDEEYDDEYSLPNRYRTPILRNAMIVSSLLILLILCVVIASNRTPQRSIPISYNQTISSAEAQYQEQSAIEQSVNDLISGSTLTADDLDIWGDEHSSVSGGNAVSGNSGANDLASTDNSSQGNASSLVGDPATDGLHTRIIHEDGEEEWVEINQYLPQNEYDYSGLVYQKPLMKYYENNTRISYAGVDISKEQDYVDFNELKKAGIEFVMLRVGQRGYTSGEITMDENFTDNIKRATEAGLDVGVYFFSQAITIEEAEEEAQFVIDALKDYEITYPVVFYLDDVPGGQARTDALDKMQQTNMAITFMDKIAEAGYFPMFYGDKECLIQHYSLGSMNGYDVWLSQEMDIPDYPYRYTMWQYTTQGRIDGIAGNARLNICFIDYSVK